MSLMKVDINENRAGHIVKLPVILSKQEAEEIMTSDVVMKAWKK